METMREYMSKLVTGWDVDKVQPIVAETLDEIVDPIVYEEAVELIAEHKAAGRDVIIISSSGTEIVEPIGDRLGVDLAIGTQVAIEDGQYTGEILFYAYGEGKADAMRTLAEERGYDLAAVVRLQRLAHRPADARRRRPPVRRRIPTPSCAASPSSATGRSSTSPSRSPCATQIDKRQAVAAGGAVAIGAVALGLTWYARRRGCAPDSARRRLHGVRRPPCHVDIVRRCPSRPRTAPSSGSRRPGCAAATGTAGRGTTRTSGCRTCPATSSPAWSSRSATQVRGWRPATG